MRISISYDGLPSHMREGARQWVEQGLMTGGFLTAVMQNKLVEAFQKADETNSNSMWDWANWLYNEAPSECWGSVSRVEAWRERHAEQRATDKGGD